MEDFYVLPHFLDYQGTEASGYVKSLSDPVMRVGRVSKAYSPNEATNGNKRHFEYDVEVEHSDFGSNFTTITYPRARVVSLFGGIADYLRFTPRIEAPKAPELTQGSLVLVLCINGDTQQAVIIGGIPHPKREKDDPSKGHNLEFSFNGIFLTINQDGELEAKFRGATNPDNTLASSADPAAEGTLIQFKKDGNIEVESTKELHIVAREHVNIESTGVNLGGASNTEALVMGTTFREKQEALHQSLASGLSGLSSSLATAQESFRQASFLVPQLAGAVAAMGSASGAAAALASAIQEFESFADSYLSKKNTTD